MSTIWDVIETTSSERPKYTRYELAKLVKNKRESLDLSILEVASQHDVEASFWESIENASRTFNVKIYKLIAEFLNMSKTELLAKEVDDMSSISFRAQNETQHEIKEAIEIANFIFNEMVMQEKIAVQ